MAKIYGYANRQKRLVIHGPFFEARAFRYGCAAVEDRSGWGLIGLDGRRIHPASFGYEPVYYPELKAICVKDDAGWLFLRPDGKPLHAMRFDSQPEFHEGLAAVSVYNRHGYIDQEFHWLVTPRFDYADHFDGGVGRVRLGMHPKQVRYGLIGRDGRYVVRPSFRVLEPFSEGLAAAKKNRKMGFIDPGGRTAIPFIYDYASDFIAGTAAVRWNGKYGLINRRRQWVLKPIYDEISNERRSARYASVVLGGKPLRIDLQNLHARPEPEREEGS